MPESMASRCVDTLAFWLPNRVLLTQAVWSQRKYAVPNFIQDRHHAANVFLAYYHYRTQSCNPFAVDWGKAEPTPFDLMTPEDIDFLMTTRAMVKAQGTVGIHLLGCPSDR